MERFDRSNTNWTPWPRLAHVPQRFQVIGGVATIMFGGYLMMKWRTSVGGKMPTTMTKEWQDATAELGKAKEMESGAEPVVMNPISKHLAERNASK